MNYLASKLGQILADFLQKPSRNYVNYSVTSTEILSKVLRPGDVLLVEGNHRISLAIKYLTQSTWSHAAMYIGDALGEQDANGESMSLVEADLKRGVIAIPLSTYANFNTRICRPVNLIEEDRDKLVNFMVQRIGYHYDMKNVLDLLRYLLPTPPVPVRWRRRMLALGSGDPTRAICSTLMAQAFQYILYPILPEIKRVKATGENFGTYTMREIMHIRHFSLFTPRDFDLSPYFMVVKPTIESGFNYKGIVWDKSALEGNYDGHY